MIRSKKCPECGRRGFHRPRMDHTLQSKTCSTCKGQGTAKRELPKFRQRIGAVAVLAITLLLVPTASAAYTTIDDFDDNDIVEYSGDDGAFSTNSSRAYSGPYSLTKSSNDASFTAIYNTTQSIDTSVKVNVSCRYYFDGTGERGGCGLFSSDGNGGYITYIDPIAGAFKIGKLSSTSSYESTLVRTSNLSISQGWYQSVLQKDGDTYTAWLIDSNGTV